MLHETQWIVNHRISDYFLYSSLLLTCLFLAGWNGIFLQLLSSPIRQASAEMALRRPLCFAKLSELSPQFTSQVSILGPGMMAEKPVSFKWFFSLYFFWVYFPLLIECESMGSINLWGGPNSISPIKWLHSFWGVVDYVVGWGLRT